MSDARLAEAWRAAEGLVSEGVERRRQALDMLLAGDALATSPLVVYLLATRLAEPDLALRGRIVNALARSYEAERDAPPRWRLCYDTILSLLAAFGRPEVERLLEAAVMSEVRPSVAALLDRVPNLAGTLTRIASDRAVALPTRAAAVAALGELGVIEALPALEGLKTRIEGQGAGQLAMAFAPAPEHDYRRLLRSINSAIEILRENE